MSGLATEIITPRVCDMPVSDAAESLWLISKPVQQKLVEANLISMYAVSGTACTNFKVIWAFHFSTNHDTRGCWQTRLARYWLQRSQG